MKFYQTLFIAIAFDFCTNGLYETQLRVETYNIKLLDARKMATEGDRQQKFKSVIEKLSVDVIAFQEIDDRGMLKRLSSDEWRLVI